MNVASVLGALCAPKPADVPVELLGKHRPKGLPTVVGKIWILLDMAVFRKKKNDFFDYTAFGRVWYGAKYSHRVWEQFAHTFEKYFFLLKSISVNYLFSRLFSTFAKFLKGFAVIRRIYKGICCHSPKFCRD